MHPFGFTRSRLTGTHAFITPASHVQAPLPGWTESQGIVLVSPQMGARFTQFAALMEGGAIAGPPLPEAERFLFVEEGQAQLQANGVKHELVPGSYAYLPPNMEHQLSSRTPCRITLFEKMYSSLEGVNPPTMVVGREQDVTGDPFMDDEDAMLQTLLPTSLEFDMAVNRFTFQPGAALPFVEAHVMEHGLLMLQGQGIYRLGDEWFPVIAGDVIWMASFCPQWFAAVGKEPASYLYYKDVGRDPLAEF